MKIDFKKIINIKNKKDLNNFKLDKPIFLNNYLFHYLIIFKNLKALKLYKFPVYIENNNNLNGFHLAAKEYDFDILCYLIDTYPDYIYNKNKDDNTFINFIPIQEINKLMIKYSNIDWKFLINPENIDLIIFIITNLNYKQLKKFILLYDYKPTNICPYIFSIVESNKLTIDEKILLFNKLSDEELNIKYYNNSGILSYLYDIYNNEKLIIYLIDRNVDYDYVYSYNNNPLRDIIKNDILNDKHKLSLLLLNKLKNKNIFILDTIDIYLNNLLHYIFYIRLNYNINYNNYKIDEFLIKLANNDNLNQKNKNSETPLEIITSLNYEVYSKLLLNIEINKTSLNKIKNKKWLKLFNTFSNYNENNDNDIIIKNYKHINYSTYNATFIDLLIYIFYLKNKYDFLYIPTIKNYMLNNLIINYKNYSIYNEDIYKNPIYPFIIIIKSSTEYYIHPYLNYLINNEKKNKKYKYSIIYLYILNLDDSIHANMLIYNFKNLTIERFEPYGNNNNYYIDDILEENLTWNTGFKYINPISSQPFISFQKISDEHNRSYEKHGVIGGFCLAWCIWYVETKMLNQNIESIILINKLIKKINNLNINFIDYIRNYANILINEKYIFFKKINYDNNKIYNKYYSYNDHDYIINNINKYINS